MVLQKIDEIHKKNKIPIIEGGSGFYLNFLLTSNDLFFEEEKWKKAHETAREIINKNSNWNLW